MDIKSKREEVIEDVSAYICGLIRGRQDITSSNHPVWKHLEDEYKESYRYRARQILQIQSKLGVMLVDKEAEVPGHIPCRGLNPEVTLEQYQSLLHDIFRFLTVEDSYVKAYPLEGK